VIVRVLLGLLAVVAVGVAVVVGLRQASAGEESETAKPFDLPAAQRQLADAPAPLAGLYEQGNELLDGGPPAFRAQMRELRGHPVVINKWASWCNPCRAEFPVFQQLATEHGREIAFVGVNSGDSTQPARKFLAQYPVPFPSYVDPAEKIAREIKAPANYPVTVFVDRHGETAFIHQGGYSSKDQLQADIDRYLQ
jgi:cytochrome c biogenesis protein CcmG, thiol:disulfide interchange protein DsbE